MGFDLSCTFLHSRKPTRFNTVSSFTCWWCNIRTKWGFIFLLHDTLTRLQFYKIRWHAYKPTTFRKVDSTTSTMLPTTQCKHKRECVGQAVLLEGAYVHCFCNETHQSRFINQSRVTQGPLVKLLEIFITAGYLRKLLTLSSEWIKTFKI